MKISLQLKLGQSLSMTPQLQQAIKLLQLSTLDLQQEISQVLESNPMLELIEHNDAEDYATESESIKDNQSSSNEPGESDYLTEHQSKSDAEAQDTNQTDGDWGENIPTELSTDSQWEALKAWVYTGPWVIREKS